MAGASGADGTRTSLAAAGRSAWALLGMALVATATVWIILRLLVVVVPVVVALLLTSLLRPAARRLRSAGLGPALSTWIVLLGLLGVIAAGVVLLAPPVTREAASLSASVDGGFTRVQDWLVTGPLGLSRSRVDGWAASLRSQAGNLESDLARGALARTPLALEVVAGSFLVVVLTFFFVKDGDELVEHLPIPRHSPVWRRLAGAWRALTGYARGLVVNAVVNSSLIGLALVVLRVPLALPVAVLTFVASFVPIAGAIVAGTLASLIALVEVGPVAALAVIGVTVVVHHLEGYVVGPLVIGRTVGVHPVVLVLALLVGIELGGIAGGFLAGPLTAVVTGWLGAGGTGNDTDAGDDGSEG